MNEADSRHLGSQLESLGYRQTDRSQAADLVVLNTCVVRQQAEDKAVGKLQHLRQLKMKNPDLTVALMGCMVGMREAPRLRERFPFVDVFMPPSETEPLLEHLAERGEGDAAHLRDTREKAVRSAIQDEEHILPALQQGKAVTAHVPIVLGCSHACTFCIIPYRRGAERSKPRGDILHEVRRLVDQGVREVTLLGQIVDRYGLDLDEPGDLADLLQDVADVPGLARVRFLTSHPNWMTDRLIDTVAGHPVICPQFEIPSQAGSNTVLERMKRGYSIQEYEAVVDRIRDRAPDAAIHTDIIVGFPGETEEEFQATVDHLERVQADKVHLAKYSERPKTIAGRKMTDDVPEDEKERRRIVIDTLQTRIQERAMARLEGHTVEVLVEGRDEKRNRWRGRTPQAKLVFFPDEDRDRLGRLVRVHLEQSSPYSFVGRPADTPAQAHAAG